MSPKLLGTDEIKLKTSGGDGAGVTESTKVMFIAWQSECPPEVWDKILESPIRTIFDRLAIVPAQAITGPPHGRSWRYQKQTVDPREAETFCCYARVLAASLTAVLQKSGHDGGSPIFPTPRPYFSNLHLFFQPRAEPHDGIYTIPKSEFSNLADARFSIVWNPFKDVTEARTKADSLDYSLGLVRSSKDKPSFGIRIWSRDFDRLWDELKPGKPKPNHLPGEHLHKLTPVPTAATFDAVAKWIQLESLQLRPMRALNATSWMLIGPKRLERMTLTWKHNAVMLQPIDSKYQSRNQVFLAGKKPSNDPTPRHLPQHTGSQDGIDPLTIHDPWADAASTSSSSTARSWRSASTNGSSSSAAWPTKPAFSAPPAVGPDSKAELETMKSQISALESAVQGQRKNTSCLHKQVHEEIQEVRKELNTKVQDVKDSFQRKHRRVPFIRHRKLYRKDFVRILKC